MYEFCYTYNFTFRVNYFERLWALIDYMRKKMLRYLQLALILPTGQPVRGRSPIMSATEGGGA